MPFFRVHTAFSGPPVIPHCKDIRFRVIAGYPDYGSSYHFYRIAHQRPQTVDFPPPVSGGRSLSCRPFLAFVPGSACAFVAVLAVCSCFCCLFSSPLSDPASAVRFRFRRPVSLSPSCFCFRHPVPSPPSFPACAVRFSGPLPGDEKACGHNRAAGFPEQALLPFGERYSASSTNTALS